jgi:hypothetical protein
VTDILEPNLCGVLAANLGVQEVVQDRVFAQMIPQHDASAERRIPCLVVTRVGSSRQARHCDTTDPLLAATYQVDSYATTYETSARAAQAARLALVTFSGDAGAVRIQKVFLETDFDVGPDPDPGLYRRSLQFSIWYYE